MPVASETIHLLPGSSLLGSNQSRLRAFPFPHLASALLWAAFLTAVDQSFVLAQNGNIASKFSQFQNSSLLIIVFAIVNTVCNPLLGKLAKRDRKLQVVAGACVLFGFGNLLCAVSPIWLILVACRGIVGIGSAGLGLMATVLWSDTQSLSNLAIWQSYSVASETLGWVVGGPLGEIATEINSWRIPFSSEFDMNRMFAFQASLIIPCIVLIFFPPQCEWPGSLTATDPRDDGLNITKNVKFDFLGAFLCIVAFLPPIVILSIGGQVVPWHHPLILALGGVSLPAIAVFIRWELRTTCEPIVPVGLVFGAKLSRPFMCLLLLMVAHNSVLFLLPLYVQVECLGLGKFNGIVVSVFMIAMTLGAIIGARFVKRFGPNLPLVVSLALLTVYYFILAQGLTVPNHWAFLPTISLIGFFAGIPPNCLLVCIVQFSPNQDKGAVIGMFQVLESFGGLVAITTTSASLRLVTLFELRKSLGTDPVSEQMFKRFLEDVNFLRSVPSEVRIVMQAAYGSAARRCCLIAFASCMSSLLFALILPRLDHSKSRNGLESTSEDVQNHMPEEFSRQRATII